MLSVAVIGKGLAEVLLMLMLGRWVVGLFSGIDRAKNPIYQAFELALGPVDRMAARLTSNRLSVHATRRLAVWLVLLGWIVLTWVKVVLVRAQA